MARPRPRGQRPPSVVPRRLRPPQLKLPVLILFGEHPGWPGICDFGDWKLEDPTASRYTCPPQPPGLSGLQTSPASFHHPTPKPPWMSSPSDNSKSTSSPASPLPSADLSFQLSSEPLVQPLTESARVASWKQLSSLHPGNRFRLMYAMPLLPEGPGNGASR